MTIALLEQPAHDILIDDVPIPGATLPTPSPLLQPPLTTIPLGSFQHPSWPTTATTLLAQHLVPLHTAHPFHPLSLFNLPLIGILRWRPLWYYYLDPAIDHTHNPPLQVPPPYHALPLHLRHFNHLLLLHHKAPSHLLRLRNFDNFAFNFNNNNNNNKLLTFSNKLSSNPRSTHSFPHSNSTFHLRLCPSPQHHLPISHRTLHQLQSLHRHQHHHRLHRNLPTFPYPSSHFRLLLSLLLPPMRHRPIALLIVHCDLRPLHDLLSNGLGTDLIGAFS